MAGRKKDTQGLRIKDVHKGYVHLFRQAADTMELTEAELFEKMCFLIEKQHYGEERAKQNIRFFRRMSEASFDGRDPN